MKCTIWAHRKSRIVFEESAGISRRKITFSTVKICWQGFPSRPQQANDVSPQY